MTGAGCFASVAGSPQRGCRSPAIHRWLAATTGSISPQTAYVQPSISQARRVAANACLSSSPATSRGRESITSAPPLASRAKKSGACRAGFPAGVRQHSQNGCETIAVTSGSKSSATRCPRSTHDSNPTCLPIFEDQNQPG